MAATEACVSIDRSAAGAATPDDALIRSWVAAALSSAGVDAGGDIAIRYVDESAMQQLNRDYRGRDAPTNVLSFPAAPIAGLPKRVRVGLGDIAVCPAVVAAEAAEQGKSSADHHAHMLVHGVLHLLGYDHESAADAEKMEALERRVLDRLGIGDPYAGRAVLAGET